jgi:hypothetical protein
MVKACVGLFLIVLFSAVFPAYSQSEDAEGWYYGQTVRRIDFDGLNNI